MNNRHIIESCRGVTFNNDELIDLLTALEPEDVEQENLITNIVQRIYKIEHITESVRDFLDVTESISVINKSVNDLYNEYCIWCELTNVQVKSKIALSKAICKEFNVITKVHKIDGKSVRVYRAAK